MRIFALKPHLILLILVVFFFFSITLYTGWRLPLSAGPDEVAHFKYARFLKQEGYLPLTPEDRELAGYKSDQPPLNAILVTLVSWNNAVNESPYVKITHSIPRRHLANDGWVDQYGVIRYWDVINTEDPLVGEILLWRIGRLLSTIFSSLTLVFIYLTAKQVFAGMPQSGMWALSAVISVAFIPVFIFISSVFSYEALLGFWLSVYLFVAAFIFRGNQSNWLYLLSGLCAGLAIITKLGALPMPLSLVILILLAGFRKEWTFKQYLTKLATGIVGLVIGAGWWFIWIIYNLNKVNELGWVAGLLSPITSGDGSDKASSVIISELTTGGFKEFDFISWSQLQGWLTVIFNTFWAPYPKEQNTTLTILFILSILALTGLVRVYLRYKKYRLWLGFLSLHIALFFILPLMRLILINSKTVAGQGHHILFPAVGAAAIFIVWGLGAWFPSSKGWLAGMLFGGGLMIWTIIHIGQIFPVVTPVPVRTIPPVLPASASEFEVVFDKVRLKGYELIGLTEEGVCCDTPVSALRLNLYWLAEGFSTEDYRVQVSLVNSKGEPQTAWMGYTANGRYPGRAWEPGDIIRDEIYLSLPGLDPSTYTVQLQMWGNQAPFAAVNGETVFNLTQVQVQLPQPASELPPFSVWQTGHIVANMPVFENRSTIQITTLPEVHVSGLLSESGAVYEPVYVAGQTHNFIVDPLWPRGNYRLQLTDGKTDWQTEPIFKIVGQERQTEIPYSQIEVKANFANQIMLLGYNLPKPHIATGERLPLTLNWQALQNMPTDFMMFTRIRDATGQMWGGYDRWPRESYSPLLWAKGEVVEDGFTVEISPNAPEGLYYLDVGFYFMVGQSPVSLPLVQNGQMSDITSVTVGPFKVGGQLPVGVTTKLPHPDQLLNQSFGNAPNLTLIGYDIFNELENSSGQIAASLKLILYWRSEAPLDVDYTTFVHIRNSSGDIVVQKDQSPLEGTYPTGLWDVGEIIADEIIISFPNNLPAREYRIIVGMYDFETGQRLNIPDNPTNELILTTIQIP